MDSVTENICQELTDPLKVGDSVLVGEWNVSAEIVAVYLDYYGRRVARVRWGDYDALDDIRCCFLTKPLE